MVLHLSRALQTLRITLLIACNHFFFRKFVMNNLIWSYKLFLFLWSGKAYQSNVCVFIFPTEFPVYGKTKWTSFKVVSCKMQAFSSFSALFVTVTSFCLSQQQSFRFLSGNSHTLTWFSNSCTITVWGTSCMIIFLWMDQNIFRETRFKFCVLSKANIKQY